MNTTTSVSLLAGEQEAQTLDASIAYCRSVARKFARNFYYGLKLTPEPKRSAMYAVYAWMRRADDLADEAGQATDKVSHLEAFRRQTVTAINSDRPAALEPGSSPAACDLIWPAVRRAVLDFDIPAEYLHAMIDGQLIDQHKRQYETFEQLYDYCYKVASVVGLVCITVWGYSGGQATQKLAEYRGIGLQLTNILRDLVEDAARGRVYLPANELARYGYDPPTFRQQLVSGQVGGAFADLMADQVARANRYYQMSASLEQCLDPTCRATSWAMARIYHRLLQKIARRPRLVLAGAVRLGRLEKATIAMHAAWSRGLHR